MTVANQLLGMVEDHAKNQTELTALHQARFGILRNLSLHKQEEDAVRKSLRQIDILIEKASLH